MLEVDILLPDAFTKDYASANLMNLASLLQNPEKDEELMEAIKQYYEGSEEDFDIARYEELVFSLLEQDPNSAGGGSFMGVDRKAIRRIVRLWEDRLLEPRSIISRKFEA